MQPVIRELPLTRDIEDARFDGEYLSGTAIVFNQASRWITEDGTTFQEFIERGAFPLDKRVSFTFRHNNDAEYGDNLSGNLVLTEDERGIHFRLKLPTYAKTLKDAVANEHVRGMSFQFIPTDVRIDGNRRYVRKGELIHIACVQNPAYPQTTIRLENSKADYYINQLALSAL
jgi:HK97 family phage prohead protease